MKKLIVIILFINSYQVFSQDPQIFENPWYLHDLVIDGISNVPPVNEENPYVPANFFENGDLVTGMCDEGGIGELEYFGTTEFEIIILQFLGGGCNDSNNQSYSSLYRGFWDGIDNDIVSYEIIVDGSSRSLIITGVNNDYAIYGNELLAVEDFEDETFSIYPNPAQTEFTINHKITTEGTIKLYDITGKEIKTLFQGNFGESTNLTFSTEGISSGFYLLTIQSGAQRLTKKLIVQ